MLVMAGMYTDYLRNTSNVHTYSHWQAIKWCLHQHTCELVTKAERALHYILCMQRDVHVLETSQHHVRCQVSCV
jgi:hypothetical protein